ncbi:PTS sugar transporter subunit IIC [Clostridioides difficile]|nr:PTS sugar transporter subunit IIC [Clostridioides difficile]
MEKFASFLERKIMPVAAKISNQRHMRAVRAGIIATLPLTIVGSFFTILLNIPIDVYMDFIAPFKATLDIPFRYTVGFLSLYATFGIASSLAKSYDLDTTGVGMLAVMAFLVSTIVPTQVVEPVGGVIEAGRWMDMAKLNSPSLFGAIVTSLITVEIYRFMKEKNITIKMPAGVPVEVSNSFTALLPTAVILMLFWVLGIHGPAIMGPVIRPIWDMSIAENITAFTEGVSAHAMPNIFTEQFLQWYVWIGGAGATLALVVMFMFSKSQYLKSLGRLGFLPGLFNINEPIIFGAPIVMNPILGIPFIIGPIIMTILSYVLTITGVIPMMVARLPFAMPAPIAAVMSTNWSILAGILVLINFVISFAVYYPFFKVFEKQQLQREQEEMSENL